MTGIERLHKLIADIDVNADPELWYILRGGTEGYWDCERCDDKTLKSTLADIADQIEREQGAHVSRMRVLAVVTEMERHVSGVEGMEDSPVARWARELREALGGDGRDHADFLPADERDAIAWVREHGGLDYVKSEWRSRVPHERYEARRQRLLGHIAECEAALGRRREIISKLTHHVNAIANENVGLRRRAMPEGCEWPRYESGELVNLGDDVSRHGEDFEANAIALYRDGSFSLNFWAYSKGERVKRPEEVPAADGEPLEVGQTVWDANGDELVIGAFEDGGHTVTCRYADIGDGIPTHGMWSPSDLTHTRPVLDADGLPLREREHVYHVETGAELVVKRLPKPGEYQAVVVFALPTSPASHLTSFDPDQLTHKRPDSWERIEEDAKKEACAYFGVEGGGYGCSECRVKQWEESCDEVKSSDLVRRCRALAERERGE